MTKATFSMQQIVRIMRVEIRSKKAMRPAPSEGEEGLVLSFMKFVTQENLVSVSDLSTSGDGSSYSANHSAEDAPRIEAWLLQQGVVKKEVH